MTATGPGAVAPEVVSEWSGTVEDGQQPRRPLRVGVALALGVVLWLGAGLGVHAVLRPARVAAGPPARAPAAAAGGAGSGP